MSNDATKNPVPTFDQISAGGVVYRGAAENVEVIIVQVVPELRWQLPKGVIDEGETNEQAALREVREEAGVDAEIVKFIETSEYWFTVERDGEMKRCHKFVHFFLMRYVAGDVRDHDHEVAEARWVPIETALEMFTFDSDREVVRKARDLIWVDPGN
jgi:8-oxo-dGTP pyrophosphatase MutT (NUDIX family)